MHDLDDHGSMPTEDYSVHEEYLQCLRTNNDLVVAYSKLQKPALHCSCKKMKCDDCTKAKARMVVMDPLLAEAAERVEVARLATPSKFLAACDSYESADSAIDEQKGSKVPDGRTSKRKSRRRR